MAFVSSVRGVEAITQTSPFDNFIAVDRPPKGRMPNLENGLKTYSSNGVHTATAKMTHQENVQTSFVTCEQASEWSAFRTCGLG